MFNNNIDSLIEAMIGGSLIGGFIFLVVYNLSI